MDTFVDFFTHFPTAYKILWVASCLALSWSLEALAPLFRHNYKKIKHIGTNLVFFSFNAILNALLSMVLVGIFIWIETDNVGLLSFVDWHFAVELLIAVMALDFFAQYVAHVVLHKVKWMWKFHMVHHSDTQVDATTGTRHHPGDYLIREAFAVATVIIFGIPVAFYVFYRIATLFFTYLNHANINVNPALDKKIAWLFVSPNLHKFHHHFERPWTDRNYGNIFSIWDRIFGTLVYDNPKNIQYGLDVLDDKKDANIGYQLQLPLDKNVKTDY